MGKMLNLAIANHSLSDRVNLFAERVYLRELATLRAKKVVEELTVALDNEENLNGVMGHDERMQELTAALKQAEEKLAAVRKDPQYRFERCDADRTLSKTWRETKQGIEGKDKRMEAICVWLKTWGISPERDAVEELDYRLCHDSTNGANGMSEGKATKLAGLNVNLLYREMVDLHFQAGLMKEDLCPEELKDIWAEKKAAAEAKRAARKAARKARSKKTK